MTCKRSLVCRLGGVSFLVLVACSTGARCEEEPSALADIDLGYTTDQRYLARVKRRFDLSRADVAEKLAKKIASRMTTIEQGGMSVVVLANGTRGVLWTLDKLHDDSLVVRQNAMASLRFSRYREVFEVFVRMLSDKRTRYYVRVPKWEPPPSGATEMRVCDLALHTLGWNLGDMGVLYRGTKRRPVVSHMDPIDAREKQIDEFLEWWEEEGRDLVEKQVPSLVTAILARSRWPGSGDTSNPASQERPRD